MPKDITRRQFVQTTSLAAVGALGLQPSALARSFSANDTIGLGIIGAGIRGQEHIRASRRVDGLEVTACCDILPFRLEEALKLSGGKAKGYDDYRRLLEDPAVDAVVISVPLYLHAAVTLDALAAGKHIYCEKTMAYNIEQSLQMSKAASRHPGQVFMMGYQLRLDPGFINLQGIISKGWLGPIAQIQTFWNRNGDWRRPVPDPKWERTINWRMYREYSGGLMAELCSHNIDLVNWMLNAHPLRAMGFGGIDFWKDGRETLDNVHCIMEYPGGVKVVHTSLTTNRFEGFQLRLYGTRGTIIAGREGDRAYARLIPEPPVGANKPEGEDAVAAATWDEKNREGILLTPRETIPDEISTDQMALTAFAGSIRNGTPPPIGIRDGLLGSIAVAMGNEAIDSGQIVEWKESYLEE